MEPDEAGGFQVTHLSRVAFGSAHGHFVMGCLSRGEQKKYKNSDLEKVLWDAEQQRLCSSGADTIIRTIKSMWNPEARLGRSILRVIP
jgi:hypothetical protein